MSNKVPVRCQVCKCDKFILIDLHTVIAEQTGIEIVLTPEVYAAGLLMCASCHAIQDGVPASQDFN